MVAKKTSETSKPAAAAPTSTAGKGLAMPKNLAAITEAPAPNPEAQRVADEVGGRVVAWSPQMLDKFVMGQVTLGELEGIDKAAQYKMAETGHRLLNEGKLEQARQVFEGLFALDPFDAYFITALGSIAQQKQDWETAEALYSRALDINPYSATALANRGEVRIMRNNVLGGVEDFAKAIEEDPKGANPATIRARALLAAVKGKLEGQQLHDANKNMG